MRAMIAHTDKDFDQELRTLGDRLVHMTERASEQIALAMKALTDKNDDIAREVIKADDAIDKNEMEIDELTIQLLATRQPVATDLRFITIRLKFVVDVEHISDLAVGIAKRTLELNRLPVLDPQLNYTKLAALVQKNLHLAL